MTLLYSWKVHSFKQRPLVGTLIIGLMILLICYLLFWEKSILFTVLAFVFVIMPTFQFYFPQTFILNEEDIRLKSAFGTKRYEWEQFKAFDRSGDHFFLHTSERGSKKNRRGDVVLFHADNVDVVNEIISRKVIKNAVV